MKYLLLFNNYTVACLPIKEIIPEFNKWIVSCTYVIMFIHTTLTSSMKYFVVTFVISS